MQVKNKWNKKIYSIVNKDNGKVILQRVDGSRFEISEKEFKSNYADFKPIENKGGEEK
jgi:hypothetical protein